MPGSYQVTPAILGRRRATQRITVTPASKPGRPTASYRVSPPPARGPTSRVGRHRPSARDPDTEASYPGRPAGRGQPFASRFPAAFRPPAFASRSSDSRRGIRPSSRLAYRARPSARTPTGVTAFRTHELRPGVGAPYNPRTSGARPAGSPPRPAPAASQRPVPKPRHDIPPCEALLHGPSTGVHSRSPVRSSPRPRPPGWNRQRFGFPLSFAPRRHRQRTSGAGTGHRARTWNYRSTHNRRSPIR